MFVTRHAVVAEAVSRLRAHAAVLVSGSHPELDGSQVVPGALTTKEVTVVGERRTAEVDFETEVLMLHDAYHELRDGSWTAVVEGAPHPPVEPCDPVQMVCRELDSFLRSVETRRPTAAGPVESGVHLAILMEAIYESARSNTPVKVRVD
jgi:predicted dehydrogenase